MQAAERNRLVVDNLPLVGYLVSELCARATHLSREDLASVGAVGLVLAADAFDPSAGVPFGAYARRRVSGALLDELRSLDWAGRGTRQRIKSMQAMSETLAARLGRAPSHEEMASALGVTSEQVRDGLADAARVVGPLDAAAEALAAETVAPEDAALERERVQHLGAAVAALPDRLRFIVTEIYLEGRAVKDVAAELGLTSSAVSQQRGEALRLMRAGLETHFADEPDPLRCVPAEAGHALPVTPRRAAYLESVGEAVQGFRQQRALAGGGVRRTHGSPSLEAAG
ncbi:FliA/WhiG family RNA polymerase sigma factor [Terrabacter aerolatus]|uniref:RNA polymerase sigma factor n=1 Tax=Terrabacter aerolatus TaxID=422442 RepID=A0A512CVQ8_9MICO|nr:sigma-70 family RNA polymerase sigma factor [Terrabacter aerolatus]GEO28309.1 RNA polymerase sigma factor [Terrabacter aerolatus]